MMGSHPQCYKLSFIAVGRLVPEKKTFEGFYRIWALRQSCSCVDPDLPEQTLWRPNMKFGFNRPNGFRGEGI